MKMEEENSNRTTTVECAKGR